MKTKDLTQNHTLKIFTVFLHETEQKGYLEEKLSYLYLIFY